MNIVSINIIIEGDNEKKVNQIIELLPARKVAQFIETYLSCNDVRSDDKMIGVSITKYNT